MWARLRSGPKHLSNPPRLLRLPPTACCLSPDNSLSEMPKRDCYLNPSGQPVQRERALQPNKFSISFAPKSGGTAPVLIVSPASPPTCPLTPSPGNALSLSLPLFAMQMGEIQKAKAGEQAFGLRAWFFRILLDTGRRRGRHSARGRSASGITRRTRCRGPRCVYAGRVCARSLIILPLPVPGICSCSRPTGI